MQEEQQVYKELMPCVARRMQAGHSMHLAVIHTVMIVGTLGEMPTAGGASRSSGTERRFSFAITVNVT